MTYISKGCQYFNGVIDMINVVMINKNKGVTLMI